MAGWGLAGRCRPGLDAVPLLRRPIPLSACHGIARPAHGACIRRAVRQAQAQVHRLGGRRAAVEYAKPSEPFIMAQVLSEAVCDFNIFENASQLH
jgi:hypothetical protein